MKHCLLFALALSLAVSCTQRVADDETVDADKLNRSLHKAALLQLCEKGTISLEDKLSGSDKTLRELLEENDIALLDSIIRECGSADFPQNFFALAGMEQSSYENGVLSSTKTDSLKWEEALASLKILSPLGVRTLKK